VTFEPGKYESLARIMSDVGITANESGEALQLRLHKAVPPSKMSV
jgi:hypothetical protein